MYTGRVWESMVYRESGGINGVHGEWGNEYCTRRVGGIFGVQGEWGMNSVQGEWGNQWCIGRLGESIVYRESGGIDISGEMYFSVSINYK